MFLSDFNNVKRDDRRFSCSIAIERISVLEYKKQKFPVELERKRGTFKFVEFAHIV